MRCDLQDLKLFVAIAEAGSVSGGAALCSLSASAASLRIKQLEESIGADLFERGARGVSLTRPGKVMLEHCRRCLADLQQMQADLAPYAQGLTGHIRIASNTAAVAGLVMNELGPFLREHPPVRVTLEEKFSHEIVSALAEGRIDVGIVSIPAVHPDLVFTPYREEELVVLAPEKTFAPGRAVTFIDLLSKPFVSLRSGASIHSFLAERATALGRTLDIRIQVPDFAMIVGLVQAGAGITVIPRSELLRFDTGPLQVVSINEPWSLRHLMVGAVRDEAKLSVYVRKILEHLRRAPPGG